MGGVHPALGGEMRTEQDAEREANYFALCLLVPERFLRTDLEGQPPFDVESDVRIIELAKRYDVSVQLMILRLVELGYLRE